MNRIIWGVGQMPQRRVRERRVETDYQIRSQSMAICIGISMLIGGLSFIFIYPPPFISSFKNVFLYSASHANFSGSASLLVAALCMLWSSSIWYSTRNPRKKTYLMYLSSISILMLASLASLSIGVFVFHIDLVWCQLYFLLFNPLILLPVGEWCLSLGLAHLVLYGHFGLGLALFSQSFYTLFIYPQIVGI